MKDVTDVFCLWVFGGPSASAIRSTAILPEIGSWGIAALTTLASSVSTATVTPYRQRRRVSSSSVSREQPAPLALVKPVPTQPRTGCRCQAPLLGAGQA
ncbi:hypothetical protein [Streptomyces cinereoruber]|uniref:hypothetical protein n=1 Tax=Streptomyces cinereoruber TaxID=67260 RepID=UPI00364F8988